MVLSGLDGGAAGVIFLPMCMLDEVKQAVQMGKHAPLALLVCSLYAPYELCRASSHPKIIVLLPLSY